MSRPRIAWSWPVAIVVLTMLGVTVALLRLEGRLWWCAAGDWNLWTSDAWGRHNSQHLLDPYSLTHVSHGIVFWWMLAWIARRAPVEWRVIAALAIEAIWEVAENAAWVIERYRAATAAIGYTGDTVANSIGDIAMCAVGILVAARLGWRRAAAMLIVSELLLALWIRDNLILNIVMLIHPVDAIRHWQMPR